LATALITHDFAVLQKVTIETVTHLEQLEALRADYDRLCWVTGNRLPFALFDWHITWCRHFLNWDPRIRDEPLFYVLRNPEGACVGIFPFIMNHRRLGPLKIVSVDTLGADPAISEIRTPLVESGYEHLAARAVRAALDRVPHWDWVHWAHLNGPLAEALSASATLHWQPPLPHFVLDLPGTWEEFQSGLKRNIRESLRHCYNSLKRDGMAFELEVIKEPAAVHRALERFLELHRLRANCSHGARHPDRFASKASEHFLYEICERLAAAGAVRIFALKIERQVVAMRVAFVVEDSLYLYYSGFDPRWWRYSVMTTTVVEAIKYAIAHGFKTVDLSAGKDLPKTRWGPRQIDVVSGYEPRPRLRSRLANSAYLQARTESGYPRKLLRRLIGSRRWN
jgi:CelD/BcsL family acetyltransferase involved in cellulose biosynthesis